MPIPRPTPGTGERPSRITPRADHKLTFKNRVVSTRTKVWSLMASGLFQLMVQLDTQHMTCFAVLKRFSGCRDQSPGVHETRVSPDQLGCYPVSFDRSKQGENSRQLGSWQGDPLSKTVQWKIKHWKLYKTNLWLIELLKGKIFTTYLSSAKSEKFGSPPLPEAPPRPASWSQPFSISHCPSLHSQPFLMVLYSFITHIRTRGHCI